MPSLFCPGFWEVHETEMAAASEIVCLVLFHADSIIATLQLAVQLKGAVQSHADVLSLCGKVLIIGCLQRWAEPGNSAKSHVRSEPATAAPTQTCPWVELSHE